MTSRELSAIQAHIAQKKEASDLPLMRGRNEADS